MEKKITCRYAAHGYQRQCMLDQPAFVDCASSMILKALGHPTLDSQREWKTPLQLSRYSAFAIKYAKSSLELLRKQLHFPGVSFRACAKYFY